MYLWSPERQHHLEKMLNHLFNSQNNSCLCVYPHLPCLQIDLQKMPLGKLSKRQIQSAYALLSEVQQVSRSTLLSFAATGCEPGLGMHTFDIVTS